MIDSSSVHVHQHAANVKKGGFTETDAAVGDEPHARCMGRSRGGLTTMIHALVDANGLPILLKLTEGQAHDGRSAADMLDGIGDRQILLADGGYDSDALRYTLKETRRVGQREADAEPEEHPGLQPVPLPLPPSSKGF